jgi:excisionase family DNA binding protein
MKNLLTVKELEGKFQVTRQTIYEWRKKGLPYLQIGTRVRFDEKEVLEWIREQNQNK